MDIKREMELAEKRLSDAGIALAPWLLGSGVSRATWYRWRSGNARPGLIKWEELMKRIDALPIKQMEAAQ